MGENGGAIPNDAEQPQPLKAKCLGAILVPVAAKLTEHGKPLGHEGRAAFSFTGRETPSEGGH